MQQPQLIEKHAYGGFFNENAPFAYEPAARRAASGDRNPLLRKDSETAVHAAGFGLAVRGLRPSDTSKVFRQSGVAATLCSSLFLWIASFLFVGRQLFQLSEKIFPNCLTFIQVCAIIICVADKAVK